MRIEIVDSGAQVHVIDSADAKTLGCWFSEKAEQLMSADSRDMPLRVCIWPSSPHEQRLLSGPDRLVRFEQRFNQDGLLELAQRILTAADRAGQLEAAGSSGSPT